MITLPKGWPFAGENAEQAHRAAVSERLDARPATRLLERVRRGQKK
jgi:hypothetical protein